jgi:hypothetical protein
MNKMQVSGLGISFVLQALTSGFVASGSPPITPPPSAKTGPVFDIEFKVPCGVASQDMTILLSVNWTLFVLKVSEVMGCSHSTVPSLGYIPSWKMTKGKPTPKILDGPEAFTKLIKEIQGHIGKQKSKNKGKGVVKSWSIHLMDLKAETEAGKVHMSSVFDMTLANCAMIDLCKGKGNSCDPRTN